MHHILEMHLGSILMGKLWMFTAHACLCICIGTVYNLQSLAVGMKSIDLRSCRNMMPHHKQPLLYCINCQRFWLQLKRKFKSIHAFNF